MPDPTSINSLWQVVGWLVLAIILLATALMGNLIYTIRLIQKDKQRMSSRITVLEDVAINSLRQALADNSAALQALKDSLDKRTCLLQADNQEKIVDILSSRVAEKISKIINEERTACRE
jgi:hypothetical protein